jgi:hypothetical protein
LGYHEKGSVRLFMSADSSSFTLLDEQDESKTLKVIGWFSIGMAVAAIGIYVGREIRLRYKFKKRTPYDFYSNAGNQQSTEFGVGI